MAKPTLTGQSKRLTRRPGGEMNSIDLIPPVDPPSDEGYFTDLTPFLSTEGDLSRIVYVSNSGNDTLAASNQHSRGYYLPSDPEIGPDPTNPVGPIYAFLTFDAARTRVRNWSAPDWMLYERGGTFNLGGYSVNIGAQYAGPSADKRRVFTAYGDISLPRPKLSNNGSNGFFVVWASQNGRNLAITSLDVRGMPGGTAIGGSNVLIEDCITRGLGAIQGGATDFVIRRNVTTKVWNASGHNQGMFLGGGGTHTIEENIFDMNGYKENPDTPSTWTGNKSADGTQLAAGSGVQPKRTFYDRNCYLSSYTTLNLRSNVISRGGGGGSVQTRVGGNIEENVFLFNHTALVVGSALSERAYLQNANVRRNVFMHEDHFVPPGGYGGGMLVAVGDQEEALIEDNVIAHFIDRTNNGDSMITLFGLSANEFGPAEQSKLIKVIDNDLVSKRGETIKSNGPGNLTTGVKDATINRNSVYRGVGAGAVLNDSPPNGWPDIGSTSGNGNKYHTPDWGSYASWQAAGRDTQSSTYGSLADLAAASGWKTAAELNDPQGRNGWERDIVSYMQNIDPEYVVNENVTVDDGVPEENRRVSPPVLWQVLNTGSPTYNMPALSESESKLVARRYHAFLTFIERAKANRKGSWDSRYTAKAFNNYIREGFGRAKI